jgi:hypothetical protein
VTLQVKTLIRAAEEEAANPFKVHGNEYPRAGEGALVPSGSDDGLQGLIGRIAQGVGDAISSAGNILRGAAGLLIALGIRAGNNYPGQVLIQMPKILEKLKISGRWLREQAGLARNLTHIKSANMLRHILKNSYRIPVVGVVMGAAGIAASVADTWSKRWGEYQKMGIVGGITAGAVDGAIAAIPIVAGVAGGIVGSVVGAAGGFVVGGPAGLIVGGTAGAIGVGMAGEAAGKWVARGLEGLRIRDAAVDFTTSIADRVSAMADEIGGYISDAKVPTFGFTL